MRARVRFLNTVIGKMSQVVADPERCRARHLTPDHARLSARLPGGSLQPHPDLPGAVPGTVRRGIRVLQEKDDLLPFEEAKLYGHNATHAVLGYLGAMLGVARVADLQEVPGMLAFARRAFIEESGAALIRKHAGLDPLFTPEGYREFADDLLERMTNPFLVDLIERVTRDTERKLGWNDRLAGTMRLALEQGVRATSLRPGRGRRAGPAHPATLEGQLPAGSVLKDYGRKPRPDQAERNRLMALIETASGRIARSGAAAGFPDLETFYNGTLCVTRTCTSCEFPSKGETCRTWNMCSLNFKGSAHAGFIFLGKIDNWRP